MIFGLSVMIVYKLLELSVNKVLCWMLVASLYIQRHTVATVGSLSLLIKPELCSRNQ